MANYKAWAESVLLRSIGAFVNGFIAALVGVGILDAASWVELGAAGVNLFDADLWLAACGAGVLSALTRQLIPALQRLGSRLSDVPDIDLEIGRTNDERN